MGGPSVRIVLLTSKEGPAAQQTNIKAAYQKQIFFPQNDMPRVRNPPHPYATKRPKRKRDDDLSADRKMAKVVKQIVLRNQETKHLVYEALAQSVGTSPVSFNVMYHAAARGTTEDEFIGESFFLKGISAKISGTNNNGPGTSSPYRESITIYTYIIAAKDFNTVTSLTTAQLCDQAFTNVAERHFFDPNKCKVLASAKFCTQPTLERTAGQLILWNTEMYAKVEQRVRFRNYGTDTELSGWNYYVMAWADSNVLANALPMSISFKAYIKDA